MKLSKNTVWSKLILKDSEGAGEYGRTAEFRVVGEEGEGAGKPTMGTGNEDHRGRLRWVERKGECVMAED